MVSYLYIIVNCMCQDMKWSLQEVKVSYLATKFPQVRFFAVKTGSKRIVSYNFFHNNCCLCCCRDQNVGQFYLVHLFVHICIDPRALSCCHVASITHDISLRRRTGALSIELVFVQDVCVL